MENTKIIWGLIAFYSIQLYNINAQSTRQQEKQTIFDVYEYGATGNGKTNDAIGIQKAIIACNQNGGGMVLLNNGSFLTSGIVMKSNVELHSGNKTNDVNKVIEMTNDVAKETVSITKL